jgi:transcriptional regulator with XRE-family HTH domain
MVGVILKKLRKQSGLSQKELADILEVSQQAISFYESDTKDPNNDVLQKIADYFNVSTDYLLGREQKQIFVTDNITLLKGNKTWLELEKDIATKLGDPLWSLSFNAKDLEKMSKGKLEPDFLQINALSMYAEVPESFFYTYNSQEEWDKVRQIYKNEIENKTILYLSYSLPEDIKVFISDCSNLPYLEYAKHIKDKGINPNDIVNYILKA